MPRPASSTPKTASKPALKNPLHHLFKWLAVRYDHPDPWTDDMARYGPVKSRPSTLAEDFIRVLLEVTGGGKAKSFVDVRDHAMIRMLTEGVRREELARAPDRASSL